MNKIKILDIDTIEKIAAGEVVERPYCAVKELIENSIDANSTNILIEILDKGTSLIKITDNGDGMTEEDLSLCIKRHATSKINIIEDLEKIKTLGFRGEALAAISRISKTEIITRQKDFDYGFSLYAEGGENIEIKKTGSGIGTQIIIKDLFYNVPARKKFLKSNASEYSQIISIVEKLALAHHNISFKLLIDEKVKLNLIKTSDKVDRIRDIFGKDVAENLIPFEYQNNFFKIYGWTSNSQYFEKSRNNYYSFVNDRNIVSKVIIGAVNEAYKENIVKSRYPISFIFLEMSGEFFDVNVHPQKTEIKFLNEPSIFSIVRETVFFALKNKDSEKVLNINKNDNVIEEKNIETKIEENIEKQDFNLDTKKEKRIFSEIKNLNKKNYDTRQSTRVFVPNPEDKKKYIENWQKMISVFDKVDLKKSEKLDLNQVKIDVDEKEKNLFQDEEIDLKVIGWFPSKYILASNKNFELVIIDQHAAHERINYEILKKDFEQKRIEVQGLLISEIFELPNSKKEFLADLENLNKFEAFGFFIELFGKDSLKINAVPSIIEQGKEVQTVKEILENLVENMESKDLYSQEIIDKIIMISCKNSIKANQKLSILEMETLIKRLMKTENPYHCPHGRPTIVSISQKEIDKKFARIL
jgi:DNA mismatch repair protein MutL